jgi:translation initiation factor 4A
MQTVRFEEASDRTAEPERAPTPNQSNSSLWDESIPKFDLMNLKEETLKGIYAYGYENPSAIQQRAIKPMMLGHDVIGQAQSGTGKTATFSIGMLERLNLDERGVQGLILSPTRELAQQTVLVVDALGSYLGAKVLCCVGGTEMRRDTLTLRNENVKVVVGTPGRLYAMLERGTIAPRAIRMLVIDEADEMLSRGFVDQVEAILVTLPSSAQICMFSATLTLQSLELADRVMRNPVRILVKQDELTLDGIKQFYVAIKRQQWKLETLMDLYAVLSISQAVIFCNSRRQVDYLHGEMTANDFAVSCMHGDMDQQQRDTVMREFRNGTTRVLIATDILARGIDVQSVSLVINYELPNDRENYIHRIGRSGRWGRKGVAINFITPDTHRYLVDIEKHYATEIKEMPNNVADLISVY